MNSFIVQSSEIVTLLGAGPLKDSDFSESMRVAPTLVAVDGGAKKALSHGIVPFAVIGDFDSLDTSVRTKLPADRLHQIDEQDSTDFDKALRNVRARLVLAIGFAGGRLDHELAVYNVLVRHPDQPVIVIRDHDICFHLNRALTLTLDEGTRVSLFPMAKVKCASTGLRWPTDHLTFSPWGRVGTANEAADRSVTLSPSGPGLLVILPKTALDQAISALTD